MQKFMEMAIPRSCWNKALSREMMFILIERDPAAAATIRFWIEERIRLGVNEAQDAQIQEAAKCAEAIDNSELLGAPRRKQGPHG